MKAVWLAIPLLLLMAPSASACLSTPASADGAGTVAPLLDMQFLDKQKCKAPDHSDCTVAPTADAPFEMDGVLVWEWAVDNCEATNVAISADPIVITFPPFPRNPSWLKLTMTPSEISIPVDQQWDLADDAIDPTTQTFIMREKYDIHVTIERVGEPTQDELDRVEVKNGVVEVYAKAVSSQTPGFQPGFAFENFRLDASSLLVASGDSAGEDTPAPSFGLVTLALAALAVGLRRR